MGTTIEIFLTHESTTIRSREQVEGWVEVRGSIEARPAVQIQWKVYSWHAATAVLWEGRPGLDSDRSEPDVLRFPFSFRAPARPWTWEGRHVKFEHQIEARFFRDYAPDPEAQLAVRLVPALERPWEYEHTEEPVAVEHPARSPVRFLLLLFGLTVAMVVTADSPEAAWAAPFLAAIVGWIAYSGFGSPVLSPSRARLGTLRAEVASGIAAPGEPIGVTASCAPRGNPDRVVATLRGLESPKADQRRTVHEVEVRLDPSETEVGVWTGWITPPVTWMPTQQWGTQRVCWEVEVDFLGVGRSQGSVAVPVVMGPPRWIEGEEELAAVAAPAESEAPERRLVRSGMARTARWVKPVVGVAAAALVFFWYARPPSGAAPIGPDSPSDAPSSIGSPTASASAAVASGESWNVEGDSVLVMHELGGVRAPHPFPRFYGDDVGEWIPAGEIRSVEEVEVPGGGMRAFLAVEEELYAREQTLWMTAGLEPVGWYAEAPATALSTDGRWRAAWGAVDGCGPFEIFDAVGGEARPVWSAFLGAHDCLRVTSAAWRPDGSLRLVSTGPDGRAPFELVIEPLPEEGWRVVGEVAEAHVRAATGPRLHWTVTLPASGPAPEGIVPGYWSYAGELAGTDLHAFVSWDAPSEGGSDPDFVQWLDARNGRWLPVPDGARFGGWATASPSGNRAAFFHSDWSGPTGMTFADRVGDGWVYAEPVASHPLGFDFDDRRWSGERRLVAESTRTEGLSLELVDTDAGWTLARLGSFEGAAEAELNSPPAGRLVLPLDDGGEAVIEAEEGRGLRRVGWSARLNAHLVTQEFLPESDIRAEWRYRLVHAGSGAVSPLLDRIPLPAPGGSLFMVGACHRWSCSVEVFDWSGDGADRLYPAEGESRRSPPGWVYDRDLGLRWVAPREIEMGGILLREVSGAWRWSEDGSVGE